MKTHWKGETNCSPTGWYTRYEKSILNSISYTNFMLLFMLKKSGMMVRDFVKLEQAEAQPIA